MNTFYWFCQGVMLGLIISHLLMEYMNHGNTLLSIVVLCAAVASLTWTLLRWQQKGWAS